MNCPIVSFLHLNCFIQQKNDGNSNDDDDDDELNSALHRHMQHASSHITASVTHSMDI